MNRSRTDRTPRLLRGLAWASLSVMAAAWLFLALTAGLNEDEPDTLNKAWFIDQGGIYYLEIFDLRPTLSFQAVRPLLWLFDKPSRIILAARLFQLVWVVALLWFLWKIAAALFGRAAAYWSLAVLGGFHFFTARVAQVRAEPLLLALALAGLWQFVRWRRDGGPARRLALSGLLFGAAFMTKSSAAFIAAGPVVLLVADVLFAKQRRKAGLFGLLAFAAGWAAAVFGVLYWTCGRHLWEATRWTLLSGKMLYQIEQRFTVAWVIIRTLTTNPVFWLVGGWGFLAAHAAMGAARRKKQAAWPWALIVLIGWFSLAGLPVRRALFQQDFLITGLVFALAGGARLSRRLPLPSRGGKRQASIAAVLVLALLGPFVAEVFVDRHRENMNIAEARQVEAQFWGPAGPPTTEREVDAEKFLAWLEGPFSWNHYYPHRSLWRDLALADKLAALAEPGERVLTQSGLAVIRGESLRLGKTQVFADFMRYEGDPDSDACRSIRRFMPGACLPGVTPGRRALAVLADWPPAAIAFHYSTAALLVREPETRAWFLDCYRIVYDPKTLSFWGANKVIFP